VSITTRRCSVDRLYSGDALRGSMLNIVAHLRAVDCGMDFQLSLAIRRGLLAERGSSF
jgi:hypothetical protein